MNRLYNYITILTIILIGIGATNSFAQADSKKHSPKIGLVLSGGGAKGFAHIGALKVFEEAGLRFDYVGGTSMGSIVGSLYALGYHPNSIANIIRSQDWEALMSDQIPRKYIPIEEKQNNDRFLITFPYAERKVKVRSGLHNGQLIDILLAKYLSPAFLIHDFNELPIPFLCIATDLSNGTDTLLTSGNLHQAVRASMSIPGYFTPVDLGTKKLVDGGLINNYPVAEVIEAGADFIIGVDVQSELKEEEELTDILSIFNQIIGFYRFDKHEQGKSLTDLYIKPDLFEFDVMSFDSYEEIMEKGEEAARELLPELLKIIDSLNLNERPKPDLITRPIDSIFMYSYQYNGLHDVSHDYLNGILNLKPRTWVNIDKLSESLSRAYGSGFFRSISYHVVPEEDGLRLVFEIQENSTGILAAGLHYDSDYKASVLLFASINNAGLRGSKLSVDLNLGENPLLRALYLIDRGSNIGFGIRPEAFTLRLNHYNKNKINDVYRSTQYAVSTFLQWTTHNTLRIKAGVTYESILINSSFATEIPKGFNPNIIPFIKIALDTDNKNMFPTSGIKLDLQAKYVHSISKRSREVYDKNVLVLSMNYNTNIPIHPKHSLQAGYTLGFTLNSKTPPLQHTFLIGGQSNISYYDSFIPFTGLHFIEETTKQIVGGNIGWQFNFLPDLYLTFKSDVGFIADTFDELADYPKVIAGFGLSLGYESIIGPIEISIMKNNLHKSITNFFNIGYWF